MHIRSELRGGLAGAGGVILREKIEQAQYAGALRGHEIAFVTERGEPPFPVGAIQTNERFLIACQSERTDHLFQMIELRVRDARRFERRAPDLQDFRLFHIDAPKRLFSAAAAVFLVLISRKPCEWETAM